MKYCPHCKKPSARTTGLCPHCNQDLSGAPVPEAPQAPRTTPRHESAPRPRQSSTASGGGDAIPLESHRMEDRSDSGNTATSGAGGRAAEDPSIQKGYDYESYGMQAPPMIDPGKSNDSGGASGLDLETVNPPDPIAASQESLMNLDGLSVADVAQFGRPEAGPVGALKYWWTVHQRLKTLKVELQEAEALRQRNLEEKVRQFAALGKRAREKGVNTDELEALYTIALIAQGELKGQKRKRASQSLEHKQKIDSLKAAIDIIEKKIAPVQQEEAKHKEERQVLLQQRKSIETQLKRVQIDLRNMSNLIAQRKEACASEKATSEDKDRLTREIAQFESRLSPLLKQQEKHELEVSHVNFPLDEVEQKLLEIRNILAPELQKIMALNMEIEAQKRDFAADDEVAMQQLGAGFKKVEGFWNDVGEEVIRERIKEPEIADAKKQALAARAAFIESDRRYELLTLAVDSYDRDTVKKAQTITLAALGGLLLLIIVLTIVF